MLVVVVNSVLVSVMDCAFIGVIS